MDPTNNKLARKSILSNKMVRVSGNPSEPPTMATERRKRTYLATEYGDEIQCERMVALLS